VVLTYVIEEVTRLGAKVLLYCAWRACGFIHSQFEFSLSNRLCLYVAGLFWELSLTYLSLVEILLKSYLLIIIIIKYKDEPEEDGVLLGVPTAEPCLSMSKLSPSLSWELCL
jgi:hypothetical protein